MIGAPTVDDVVTRCREHLSDLLGTPAARIDADADFDALGVDSAVAVSLLVEIEDSYGVDLPPEALFENPTLAAVAAEVVRQRS